VISLGWYALRNKKYYSFAFLVSIIMFGLSGVMFYSKTTPVAWMLTLIMSVVFLEQNKHRDVIK
jgi:O-antigen ligase